MRTRSPYWFPQHRELVEEFMNVNDTSNIRHTAKPLVLTWHYSWYSSANVNSIEWSMMLWQQIVWQADCSLLECDRQCVIAQEVPNISKDHSAFIFGVHQASLSGFLALKTNTPQSTGRSGTTHPTTRHHILSCYTPRHLTHRTNHHLKVRITQYSKPP